MKRFVLLAMAALLAVGLMGVPAMAAAIVGGFDAATGEPSINAIAYSNIPYEEGPSNKSVRQTQFTTEVQVAQWSRWSFLGTKWTWFVRKPGEYYAEHRFPVRLRAGGRGRDEVLGQRRGAARRPGAGPRAPAIRNPSWR